MFRLVILLILIFGYVGAEKDLIIEVQDGLVEGFYKTSYNGRLYASFEGIPFAAPPIQQFRFKDPQPVKKWNETLAANQLYRCLQLAGDEILGTEDCLYLNVYIPRIKINLEDNLEVIVHIHGGAFMAGSSQLAGPSKIMDRDVIYVNFNYRLGPFGFLTTEDKTFRGNYGLKDQLEALRWVQNNIGAFGGNKSSVTLIGLSSGGASVHLHYFNSNREEVLFHKAWAQSGSALNPWVVNRNNLKNSERFINAVGCFDKLNKINSTCLINTDGLELAEGIKNVYEGLLLPLAPFAPVIDEDFLKDNPLNSLITGEILDKPFMISQTTEEGLLPSILYYDDLETVNRNWEQLSPLILEFYHLSDEKQGEIARKIKDFYFNGKDLTQTNFDRFVTVCTERLFHLGAEKSVKIQANVSNSNVYFLMFGYNPNVNNNYSGFGFQIDSKKNIENFFNVVTDGVGHSSDAKYLYDVNVEEELTEEEEKVKDVMLDFLVSFAKTGKPTSKDVEWNNVRKEGDLQYLLLRNHDRLNMMTVNQLGDHEFWDSINN